MKLKEMSKYLKGRTNNNKDIRSAKCIYCKRYITTSMEIPVCSKKSCRKNNPRHSKSGTQIFISYDERMIQEQLNTRKL